MAPSGRFYIVGSNNHRILHNHEVFTKELAEFLVTTIDGAKLTQYRTIASIPFSSEEPDWSTVIELVPTSDGNRLFFNDPFEPF